MMWVVVALFGVAGVLFEGKTKLLMFVALILLTLLLAARLPSVNENVYLNKERSRPHLKKGS